MCNETASEKVGKCLNPFQAPHEGEQVIEKCQQKREQGPSVTWTELLSTVITWERGLFFGGLAMTVEFGYGQIVSFYCAASMHCKKGQKDLPPLGIWPSLLVTFLDSRLDIFPDLDASRFGDEGDDRLLAIFGLLHLAAYFFALLGIVCALVWVHESFRKLLESPDSPPLYCARTLVVIALAGAIFATHCIRWIVHCAELCLYLLAGIPLFLICVFVRGAFCVFVLGVIVVICVAATFAVPFAFEFLGRKEGCHFDRAILWCIPVPGSDDTVPLNYYVLPAYCILWGMELKKLFPSGSQSETSKLMLIKLEVPFQLFDVVSDVNVALSAWKALPRAWVALTFSLYLPTVILSFYSFFCAAFKASMFVENRRSWLCLQLFEDIPQAILACVYVFLYAWAGAPQSPFVVTTVVSSVLHGLVELIELMQMHPDEELSPEALDERCSLLNCGKGAERSRENECEEEGCDTPSSLSSRPLWLPLW